MASVDLDRLRELESRIQALEPGAATRDELNRRATEFAQEFFDQKEPPARSPDHGSAEDLAQLPICDIPGERSLQRALAFLSTHVAHGGYSTTAPGFFAYIPGGDLYHSVIGDYLAALMNPYTGHLMAAPAAVRIENQVLAWLASILGYPQDAAGNLTSGGSIANLSAILTAREAAGISAKDVERAVVYLSPQSHHCILKGLGIAGLRECVQRHVPLDEAFRMRADALEALVASDTAAGLKPWLVVASAGTTDTGAIDPLDLIADIAERYRLWYHVDAAYGGMFALCEAGGRALKGIERSDSVVLDPHKGMFIPFGVGALLVKDRGAMMAAHEFEAHYVRDDLRRLSEVSPAEHSIELSRPFRGLRIWLPLQVVGVAPFVAALEEKLLLARYAWERLGRLDRIEVGPAPDLSIFIFRALPRSGTDDLETIDRLNLDLEYALQEDGRVLFSATNVNGRRYLRFAVLALASHREAVDLAVDLIVQKLAAAGY